MTKFQKWPKTPRPDRFNIIITEKIDGSNAQILIEDGEITMVGSRNREIFPGGNRDNAGFAGFIQENAEEICHLLPDGRHYGEWAGPGIQRNPLNLPEKLFFLFDPYRYRNKDNPALTMALPHRFRVVPQLYFGPLDVYTINSEYENIKECTCVNEPGSHGNSGEGIIVQILGDKFKLTDKC